MEGKTRKPVGPSVICPGLSPIPPSPCKKRSEDLLFSASEVGEMEQEGGTLLLKLPPDTLLAVLGKLGPQDLVRCACCCRLLASLGCSDCLWIALCGGRWRHSLNLAEWRSSFTSALALFRVLSSLDRLVGLWTAQGDVPRGTLLRVTWGSSCLVACKVLACHTGELKLVKVFEIFGHQDGSFKVEITINRYPLNSPLEEVRLPGKLVWDGKNALEFAVEADRREEGFSQTVSQDGMIQSDAGSFVMELLRPYQLGRIHDHEQPPGLLPPDVRILEVQDDTSEEMTRARRVSLLQHLLEHRQSNEEDQHGPQEPTGLSFSQRALQYLLRLSSPAGSMFAREGHFNVASSIDRRRIARCSYSRLNVALPNSETDLTGLWIGIYGPHGAEILHVTQSDEAIFGTKVLGDPNVPCGEVSFRASLRLENSQVPVEVQQIVDLQMRSNSQPFHVVKMYEGNGRIAGHNFQNPLWVPGHLLVNSEHQIAFLWEDVNFVVPFEKLDLDVLYRLDNGSGSTPDAGLDLDVLYRMDS